MRSVNKLFGLAVHLLVLLTVLNASVADNESRPGPVIVRTSDEIDDFIQLHPRIYVDQLTKTNVNGRIQYTLGARIANDNLVAHNAKNQTWPTLQNVAVTLTYPTSGVGKQVTFVAIQVDQVNSENMTLCFVGTLFSEFIYLCFRHRTLAKRM